jgi:hypothetical protein
MTEISEAAKLKARGLLGTGVPGSITQRIADYIQQVSDAAKAVVETGYMCVTKDERRFGDVLAPFVLAEPVDPLEEIFSSVEFTGPYDGRSGAQDAEVFRQLLAKRGLEIRPVQS